MNDTTKLIQKGETFRQAFNKLPTGDVPFVYGVASIFF